jgi:hypothetical protein
MLEGDDSMNIDKMNRDDLRAYAKQHALAGYSKLNAPELREVVREHQAKLDKISTAGPWPTTSNPVAFTLEMVTVVSADLEPYNPWCPDAQAYTDSRVPERKRHLMRPV